MKNMKQKKKLKRTKAETEICTIDDIVLKQVMKSAGKEADTQRC